MNVRTFPYLGHLDGRDKIGSLERSKREKKIKDFQAMYGFKLVVRDAVWEDLQTADVPEMRRKCAGLIFTIQKRAGATIRQDENGYQIKAGRSFAW